MESKRTKRHVKAFGNNSDYKKNVICTTNYRWFNFVPLNLYKQFHRVANWFFVVMLTLNWVPQLNAVGKYFSILPIVIVLLSDAVKDLYEDIRRGRQDDRINNRLAQCYDKSTGQYYKKKWKHLQVGDVIKVVCKEETPADILIIDTTDEHNFAYADTSTLDGETNLKQRTCAAIPNIESTGLRNLELDVSVDIPNDDLSKLNGYIHNEQDHIALNLDNFVLRGSELRNTDYIVGLVVYAGHDTKAMQNSKGSRTKMSNIERMMNGTILIMCLILISICFISAFGQWLWLRSYSHARVHNMTLTPSGTKSMLGIDISEISEKFLVEYKVAPYLIPQTQNIAYVAFLSFFTFVIIFNQLIPMSLYIMLEITKLLQIWLLQNDLDLFGSKSINCRSMSIAEDLGQVQYIFSDKTGTLTENLMIFKCLTACKRVFGCSKTGKSDNLKSDEAGGVRPPVDPQLAEAIEAKSEYEDCNTMMIAMTICNTVMVTSEGRRGTSFSQYLPRDFNRIVYEAESPDELSLVNAAREYGYILLRRTPESCVVRQQKTIMRYKVLCTLPFDSNRKCQSIIVIHPRTMKMVMYTKGADTSVFGRLRTSQSKEEDELRASTLEHINSFAKKGLRTLAFAYRDLEQAEYQQFILKYRQATVMMEGRAEAVSRACSAIERNLVLIGGTGVEDKLQEGVPEVLSSFRAAGIVVWVLTGDKQETAVSIGYSSQVYSRDTTLHTFKTNTMESTRRKLEEVMQYTPTGQVHKQALIINGSAVEHLIGWELRKDFLALCQTCQTVVCCRVTPLQKSSLVSLIREELGVMTLAVGDGANDVGMLRQADIGIGIAGREGTQAVMASDFAIEKFRMLRKLVLVHGQWTYHRISDFIFFFFYKNLFNATLSLFYQFFNGFSGSFPQEEFLVVTFNTFWTTPGTFVSFVLNQYGGSKEDILNDPRGYRAGRLNEVFNNTNQIAACLEAIYHGIIVFSIHAMSCWDSTISKLEFGAGLTFISLTVMNLNFLVRSPNITVLLALTVFFTLLIEMSWFYGYGMLDFLWQYFNEDPHYTFKMAIDNPITWLNLLLVVILAFLPRILLSVLTSSDTNKESYDSFYTCLNKSKQRLAKKEFLPMSGVNVASLGGNTVSSDTTTNQNNTEMAQVTV